MTARRLKGTDAIASDERDTATPRYWG